MYVKLSNELFNSQIPDLVKNQMGYPANYLVKDCIFGNPEQLEDGNWICDARFRSYYNYKCNETDADVIGITNNSTNRELNQSEIDQWKQFIGEDGIFEIKYINDIPNIVHYIVKVVNEIEVTSIEYEPLYYISTINSTK